MITSVDVCILKTAADTDAEFVVYSFSGHQYLSWMSGICRGGTRDRISRSMLGSIRIQKPPLEEQAAIVRFLDRETAKIDALVAKKERLIELLQEKRTALITRAVTQGLDRNVPMKDSGFEWLGRVPAHWHERKMRYLATMISGGTPSKENLEYWRGDIPWVSPKDMKTRVISDATDHVSELALREAGLALVGDSAVLIVVRGMILAHSFPVACTTVPVTTNQDMKALRLRSDVDPLFFVYLLEGISNAVLALIEEAGHGTKRLRTDLWCAIVLFLPPLREQRAITEALDRETKAVDQLLARVREAIDRLRELRDALISAAVTGKIDVRGAA